jgi:hypothetical protein
MTPLSSLPSPPQPLPPVPGPKLGPSTPTAYADIEFLEELGNPAKDADSHVWKARINAHEPCYALKMVSRKSAWAVRPPVQDNAPRGGGN